MRFAHCLSVRGFVRYPVREALAFSALKRKRRTLLIGDLAGVPLEIPFREITMQMGF